MVRLLLIRHAATAWTAQGRFQGQTDIPLSPHGRHQATALAQRLMAETLHMLYASDLLRAWETARAIAVPHALHVHAEPRLREMAFGRWEGLTYAEIEQQDAESRGAVDHGQVVDEFTQVVTIAHGVEGTQLVHPVDRQPPVYVTIWS